MEWLGFIAANLIGLYMLIALPLAGFACMVLTNRKAMLVWCLAAIPGAALLYWAWASGPVRVYLAIE